MRTRARTNIEHHSSTTLDGDFVQFGKSIWIKELSRIDRRIRDPVITPQDTVSIFFSVQIIEHCLSVKFHLLFPAKSGYSASSEDAERLSSGGRAVRASLRE